MGTTNKSTVIAVIGLTLLISLTGCVGSFTGQSTETQTTSMASLTTQATQTDSYQQTNISSEPHSSTETPTGSTTTSPTPQGNNLTRAEQRSRFVQEYISYTNDNTAELLNVSERGETLYVNYSQNNLTDLNSYLGPLRNYVVDYVSVVDGVYRDNSSDWEVEQMLVHVKHSNGTLASRYYVQDYWVAMRESHGSIEAVNIAAYAFSTMTLYSPAEDEWVSRTIYMPEFRDRVKSSVDAENITLTRQGSTIFVRLYSEATSREALNYQLRQLLQEYAELHEFYYNSDEGTYDTPLLAQPFELDVTVSWEGHGNYYWGRINGHGAYSYTSGEYGMDSYLENFLDSGAYERGRLRNESQD